MFGMPPVIIVPAAGIFGVAAAREIFRFNAYISIIADTQDIAIPGTSDSDQKEKG